MMGWADCEECKENIELSDFLENNNMWINFPNNVTKYFHDDETSSCYEKYVEKNNLFWCNKCFKHSLKQNNFTIMDSKYYCKTCEM